MSFSTEIKNEVCSLKLSRVENISFLSGFVRNNKLENVNKISLLTENPKIVRYLYNLFKEIYGVSPLIEKGKSNNFNKNVYYNLVINYNANFILKDIMVIDDDNKLLDILIFFLFWSAHILYMAQTLEIFVHALIVHY